MRKHFILTAFILSLFGLGTAQAQEPRDFSILATQTVQLPGTTYSIVFNSPELQAGEPRDMTKLSVAISSWLSASFGLPTMRNTPNVSSFGTIASYDGGSRTIYVPEGWNGSSPAELSEFVREMTHHLQNEGDVAYECKPEQFAKAVQDRWLALFGNGVQMTNAVGTSEPRCIIRQSRVEN